MSGRLHVLHARLVFKQITHLCENQRCRAVSHARVQTVMSHTTSRQARFAPETVSQPEFGFLLHWYERPDPNNINVVFSREQSHLHRLA